MSATTGYRPQPDGMVQIPLRREGASRARQLESLAIFLIFGVAFAALGYWLIVQMRVVSFTSIAHLTGAFLSWHNDPPKLASIGFNAPPLQTIMLLPFTIISPMATSLVALCVCSGLFGGLTMMSINRLLDRCSMPGVLRYLLLVLIAATPTLTFAAADGTSQIIGLFFAAAAVSTLIGWFMTVDTRYLISSGLLFALASMSDYAMLVWTALAAAMVTVTLIRHHASEKEVEGSLITYVAPTVYAIALWVLFNIVIVHSPLGWASGATAASVNGASTGTVPLDLAQALWGALQLAWASSPLLLLVIPALLICAVAQRNELAAWVAAFSLVALLTPAAEALIYHNAAQLQLSKGLPMLLMTVYGGACLYKSLRPLRPLVAGALVIGLGLSIGIVWSNMTTYRYQDMEHAFHQAITTGSSQEGVRQPSGQTAGLDQELAMANYIDTHVHVKKSIITDNSQTYAVILLSGEPALFRTRIDHGDSVWTRQVRHPSKAIKYMLVATHDKGDLIHATYPGAAQGNTTGLTVVYSDARYALLAVSSGAGVSAKTQSDTGAGGIISVNSLPSTLPTLQSTTP